MELVRMYYSENILLVGSEHSALVGRAFAVVRFAFAESTVHLLLQLLHQVLERPSAHTLRSCAAAAVCGQEQCVLGVVLLPRTTQLVLVRATEQVELSELGCEESGRQES